MKINIIKISKIEIGYVVGGCYCVCGNPQWTRERPNLWSGYVEDENDCKKTCSDVQDRYGILGVRDTCL